MAETSRRRALFVANSSWYLLNFRANVMARLRELGWEVHAVAPPSEHAAALAARGFHFVPWQLSGRGYAPGREAAALAALVGICRRLRPELVHSFTIKATLHAQLASLLSGVRAPVVSVTGLGHAYLRGGAMRFAAESLYRLCLRPGSSVIFQNPDDREYFAAQGLLRRVRVHLIRGSGVDVERFRPRAAAPRDPAAPLRALFVGRLLREKGIAELVAAAGLLRDQGVAVEVIVAGSTQLGNPSSVNERELAGSGAVHWLGEVVPIDDLLASADLLVLPSWREGLPRTVLEAMAMGKAVVASDVPGCREAVAAGETGLLVPVRDPQALAAAIATLARDPQRREAMGIAGRARVLAEFRSERIENETLAVYREHLGRAL